MKLSKFVTTTRVAFVFVVVGLLLLLWQFGVFNPRKPLESVKEVKRRVDNVLTGRDGFSFDENTLGYDTYLDLLQGCPFKDCIPSIDNPEFESLESASSWLDDQDVVFALDYKGVQRAYPQKILNRHEIVNDIVSGDPLVITFCPLCGSSLAFERVVDGQATEFGVSGKLHNNDLVMYDRATESLWQQITGEAIVGKMKGTRLNQVSLNGMRWSQYKQEFPGGEVLSREGPPSTYEFYPYGNYEQDPAPLFPMDYDQTIHPKTVVYGLELNDNFKAYPEDKLKSAGSVSDNISGIDFNISYNNGDVIATNLETDKELVLTRLFWFAWKAFRPETELY